MPGVLCVWEPLPNVFSCWSTAKNNAGVTLAKRLLPSVGPLNTNAITLHKCWLGDSRNFEWTAALPSSHNATTGLAQPDLCAVPIGQKHSLSRLHPPVGQSTDWILSNLTLTCAFQPSEHPAFQSRSAPRCCFFSNHTRYLSERSLHLLSLSALALLHPPGTPSSDCTTLRFVRCRVLFFLHAICPSRGSHFGPRANNNGLPGEVPSKHRPTSIAGLPVDQGDRSPPNYFSAVEQLFFLSILAPHERLGPFPSWL
jgi:hypothetical protein